MSDLRRILVWFHRTHVGLFFDEIHQLHAPLRQQHAEETPRSSPQATSFLGWSYRCQYMARALLEQKVPGPQSPVCSRGGGHQTAQALPISPKQVTQSLQAHGNASSKLAWLCPAPQAVPIHQLSCCLPARRSAVVACQQDWKCHRQADRAGVWGRHLRGASCGTVMDEATRDDIPGIFHSIPHIWQTPLAEQLWCSHSTNCKLFPRGPHHGPQESWRGTRGLCSLKTS